MFSLQDSVSCVNGGIESGEPQGVSSMEHISAHLGRLAGGGARRVQFERQEAVYQLVDKTRPQKLNSHCSSRGVEITRAGGIPLVIDWLEFTLHGQNQFALLELVRDLLGALTECPHGWLSYVKSAYVLETGRVGWHPYQKQQGVHVMLPAGALGLWSQRSGGGDILGLVAYIGALGGKITRLDTAFDDTAGVLDLERIGEHLDAGAYAAGAHKKNISQQRDLAGGQTWYVGSPRSDRRLRVYDKAAERRAAGEDYNGHWVRVEARVRGKSARALADVVLNEPADAAGVVLNILDIKVLDSTEQNITRRPPAPWWRAFLGAISSVRLALPAAERTIGTVRQWLERQCAPAMALIAKADGGSLSFIDDLVISGKSRLKSHHLALLPVPEGVPI